nr:MAG TPA: hypothetical protein [Caudoviricetes sp.]
MNCLIDIIFFWLSSLVFDIEVYDRYHIQLDM